MTRAAKLSLLAVALALGSPQVCFGDIRLMGSEPCVVDIGDSPVARWFERVHCEIHRAVEFGYELALVEVVFQEGRLVRPGHLDPDSLGPAHNRIAGTIFGVEVAREYWMSADSPVDSLHIDFATYATIDSAGDRGARGFYLDSSSARDQLVGPGDRVLGLIRRQTFGQVTVGRTHLWSLLRAVLIGPHGYVAMSHSDWTEEVKELIASPPGTFLDQRTVRELSEPEDASRVDEWIAATVEYMNEGLATEEGRERR